jgi:hypothetical protein
MLLSKVVVFKMQFVANGIDATFDLGTVISAKAGMELC